MSADIAVFADPVFDRRDERVTDEGLHGLRDSSGADQATGDGGLIIRDSVHPELSGLVFSMVNKSGAPQNGFLNLEKIYKLDLQADLVVLSACETGLGKNIRGEGLVGLNARVLKRQGAKCYRDVLESKRLRNFMLMRHLYIHMRHDHMKPSAALRLAQLELWREDRWRSPFYWAAFEIYGDWE